ncbi:MAG: zinc ribbon domain-containing protein, partial [Clostridiales bacterium]|nr:zinc ribbon domain-containing protein [Clostridiales bacterium]
MFCSNCGSSVADEARFCKNCGTVVRSAVSVERQIYATPEQQMYASDQQPGQYSPPQQQTYAPEPIHRNVKKGPSKGVLIGIIAGSAVLLGLLIFFGLRLFVKSDNGGGKAALNPQEAAGVWRGMLSFDEWFPEDGTVSALVYASSDGNLPCALHVAKGGHLAELVVNDVTIPLSGGKGAHALEFHGTMGGERITMNMSADGEKDGVLSGNGSVTVWAETVPFSLRFTRQADTRTELRGASGTLPPPPEQTAPPSASDAVTEPTAGPDDITAAKPLAIMDILPGTWGFGPDLDFRAIFFAFRGDGIMAHGLAGSKDEMTFENWDVPGVWAIERLTWRGWTLHGDTVVFSGSDNADDIRIEPIDEERIIVYYEGSGEGYEFYRMGEAPPLGEYMIGTWVPETADDNGNHAALTLN